MLPFSCLQAYVLVDCGKRLHPVMQDELAGWQSGFESRERGELWLAAGSLHHEMMEPGRFSLARLFKCPSVA